jgi:hypothetical protein
MPRPSPVRNPRCLTLVEGRDFGTALDVEKHSGAASLDLKIPTGNPGSFRYPADRRQGVLGIEMIGQA